VASRAPLAALALLAAAGCVFSTPGGTTGGTTRPSVLPTSTTVGVPQGPTETQAVDAAGGVLTFAGGAVTVSVQAGSTAGPTLVSVTPISSRAPGALGTSWRIAAAPPLLDPVTLTFLAGGGGAAGLDATSLTLRRQDAQGFWIQPAAVSSDAAAGTLTVAGARPGDWAVVLGGAPALAGSFTLSQQVGTPFTATGTASLFGGAADGTDTVYYLTGTITLPALLVAGGATCVPDAQTKSLDLSVAEAHLTSTQDVFRWGINARWTLTCTAWDGGLVTTQDLATTFDTMQINHVRCAGAYQGTQVNGASAVVGDYRIDCGTDGSLDAAWSFSACTPGGTCQGTDPCSPGTVTCSPEGVASCGLPVVAQPDGTACTTATVPSGTCLAGACQ
jgi:hypothetical protein